jgi:hypothetical protein
MAKSDSVDLIIEQVRHCPITSHLETQGMVSGFREFRFSGRDLLVSPCPVCEPKPNFPSFWVYEKSQIQFYRCDDCNSQGSILDLFQFVNYSFEQIQRFLGLSKTRSLTRDLDWARDILF